MTEGEAYGVGYLSGHAGVGTPSNSKVSAIDISRRLRMAFRRGWHDGRSDRDRGVRKAGKKPTVKRPKGWRPPARTSELSPTIRQLTAGK